MKSTVSRRQLMQMGIGAAATTGLTSATTGAIAHASTLPETSPGGWGTDPIAASVTGAFTFLDQMIDAYVGGTTIRLCQSYSDQIAGGTFYSTAFIYDNAVLALAYLAANKIGHAQILGDAILAAQALTDMGGAVEQTYFAGVNNGSGVYVTAGISYLQGITVGNVAWAGIALAQLYRRTGESRYLHGAIAAGTYIETFRDSSSTDAGFFYGPGADYKSTEHNIDVYALYTMLATLTGSDSYNIAAAHAKDFATGPMFDVPSGHFWTGTNSASITDINYSNSPEDVNTWSYLAFKDPNYTASIDWVKTNLATTDTSFAYNNSWGYGVKSIRINGMTYASLSKLGTAIGDATADADAVWIEGTGHLIAALQQRRLPAGKDLPSFHGDLALAYYLIESCMVAQNNPGITGQTVNGQPLIVGQGLMASTSTLNSGFNFDYYPYYHIAATGWYIMGALGFNPMHF
jgi:hypothetical protein